MNETGQSVMNLELRKELLPYVNYRLVNSSKSLLMDYFYTEYANHPSFALLNL